MKRYRHTRESVMRAGSLFFALRGVVRTKLAQGRRLDPSAWLRTETMKFIHDRKGSSMRALAAHLSITAPSATSLVRALVRDGVVARTRSREDKRTAVLALTPKGVRELARTMARGAAILEGVFSALSPEELAAFSSALSRLLEDSGEVLH